MRAMTADKGLIAACGLYCGACGAYLAEKCPGCRENAKATWCQVRSCCHEHSYATCADCREFAQVKDCKQQNNFISRIFGLLLGSDRAAGIALIKEKGYDGFARFMTEHQLHAIKRGKR